MSRKAITLISIFIFTIISCNDSNYVDDKLIFRYNEHANISSLDPAFSSTLRNIGPVNQIFNGLIKLDDSLNISGDLAKKWFISKNGLEYRFVIKKNIKFHKSVIFGKDSTRSVDAYDFEYSFKRLIDPNLASPGAWSLNKIKSFKALNDSIFQVNLKAPFSAFLESLSMKYFSVVPEEAVSHFGNKFGKNPIGTGPFKFKKWEENVKLILRKNELYFEKDKHGKQLPYLESISITFLPEKKSEFLEFIKGKIDYINSIDSSFKDEILTRDGVLKNKYEKSVNLLSGPYLNTEYIGFFLGKENLNSDHKKLRKAINYAIDRKKMMRFLRNNIGSPAIHGFIPIGLIGERTKGFEYDFNESIRLISEYKSENNIENIELTISTDANYLDIIEFTQRELLKVGIKINIDVLPPSTMRQAKSNGKLEMFRASWIADYPDPENYLTLFYSKNKSPFGPNYTHFENSKFDSIFLKSYEQQSKTKRFNYYQDLDSMIVEESPIIPLYYDEVLVLTKKNLKGFKINATNLLKLKEVYKE